MVNIVERNNIYANFYIDGTWLILSVIIMKVKTYLLLFP